MTPMTYAVPPMDGDQPTNCEAMRPVLGLGRFMQSNIGHRPGDRNDGAEVTVLALYRQDLAALVWQLV